MKYLCDHVQVISALKVWAGSDRLFTASYFFWNAGDTMQKFQQGLRQSLLHEILRQSPELIPTICDSRLQHIRDSNHSHSEPWSDSEISAAFRQFTSQGLSTRKFCFFIDGLDEYDGDHEDIIRILEDFTTLPQIKVCTSSRPWSVFVDAFGWTLGRKLLLEDLTREDICCYVTDLLDKDEQFVHLKCTSNCYSDLVKEIVDKAQGVFLWVFLIIRSLRKGLKKADDISDLQRRLRLLSADLETYFQHMLDNIEKCYQEQSAQIFLIATHATRALSVVTLAMLDGKDIDFAKKAEIRLHTDAQLVALEH